MKKLGLICCIWVFFVNYALGQQIANAEYFFDSDPGVGNATAINVTQGVSINETFSIPTTGLSEGLHLLHIRTQDTNGNWSLFERKYFFINTNSSYQNPTLYDIVAAEYFFDSDPGVGNGTNLPITQGTSIDENFSISTTGLSNGLHVLHIRVKDSNDTWSLFDRKYFYSHDNSSYQNPTAYDIVEAEYFFDSDPGVGNGNSLPVTQGNSINENFSIDTNGLSAGLHVLHIRAKDENNTWGLYERKYFYLYSNSDYVSPTPYIITQAEYFIDADPGVGNGNALTVSAGNSINEALSIETDGLSAGLHVLHIRAKDENETWSLYERKYFYLYSNAGYVSPTPVQIVGAEYFVDIDPGVGNGLSLAVTDGFTIDEAFEIPMDCFAEGEHELHIRVVDENGTWSHYLFETFTVDTNDVAPVTICQNITVQLDENGEISIAPEDVDNGSYDACTSIASYALSQTDFDCSDIGDNSVTLTVTNANGFPSTCTAIVTVEELNPPTIITKNISIQLNVNGNASIANNAVDDGSFDDCGSLSFLTSKTSFNCSDIGDNTVTLTVSDVSGNEANQNAIVTVIDGTPPTVITKDIIVDLDINGTITIAENAVDDGSFDACGGLTFNTDITQFDCGDIGDNIVTLTVTDSNSNAASLTAIVTVQGTDALSVIAADDIASGATTNCNAEIQIPDAVGEGDCGSSLTWEMTGAVTDSGSGQIGTYVFPIGTTTIVYTNTDTTAQTVTDSMTVTVTDNELPSITCTSDITDVADIGLCYTYIIVDAPTVSDNCTVFSVTNNFNATNDASGNYPVGLTEVVWTVVDNSGNSSECTQTITVTDNELPTINELSDSTVALHSSCDFSIPDYTNLAVVSDNCSVSTITQNPIAGTVISGHNTVQEITLTVHDNSGNINNTSFNITLEASTTYFADSDGDGFGNPEITIIDCEIPNGYIDNDLDCDDTDETINPASQSLSFSGNTNFTDKLISSTNGSPYTTFYFEVTYIDENNQLPPNSFPRVYLDYEGNGVYNNPNDRIVLMSPSNLNDLNTNDGKTYYASINNLPVGTNWETSIQIIDGECISKIGAFNYPDVQIQPDLEIFANDITFSNNNPEVATPITVFADVHNVSDFSLQDISVRLINQFDNTTYTDVLLPYMSPNSTTTVSWDIMTPNVDSWNPMQVIIDYNNTIIETNENNNSATRPFIAGDVDLAGDIVVNGVTNPSVSYASTNNHINISGYGYYDNTVVELNDPSVAGGTINFTIVETGASYSTYTNQNGNWSYSFPAPIVAGVYHITGTLTDYTLTGDFESQFEILVPIQNCLPDLVAEVTASDYQIFVGESVTIDALVRNIGCDSATINTWADATQTGGNPFLQDELVNPLDPGESYLLSSTLLNFDTPGTYSICYKADGTYLIQEASESNNTDCITIVVQAEHIDIIPYAGPNQSRFLCDDPTTSFTVRNIGTLPTGAFNCDVIVSHEGTYVTTITENVSNINPQTNYSFTINFTYPEVGEYTFELECDTPIATEGIIAESNELNNFGIYTTYIKACQPDVIINECNGVTVTPDDPEHPSTHTYNVTIKNIGNAIAYAPIEVALTRSDTNTPILINYANDISPGESETLSYDIDSVPSATETLQVSIDPNNLIVEFDESNNDFFDQLCWDFQTVPVCGTNFWNHQYYINQNINLYIGILNHDLYSATDLKVKFEVSGPGITGNLDLGNAIVPEIDKTCYCPVVAVLPYGFVFNETGTYTFTMTVDPDSEYAECSEVNNVLIRTVEVVNFRPDLTIKSENINPSLINPDLNELVSIDISYENLGLSNVTDVMQLDVFIDEILIESWTDVSGLVNGGTNTLSITTPWSSNEAGAHIVRAIIDVNNVVDETNELNNEATRAIIVGPSANLIITEFIANNFSPNLGETISFSITIENEGELECAADLELTFINDYQEEIFITTIPIDVLETSVLQIDDIPWNVLDNTTTIKANIINSSVQEVSYDDNTAALKLGNLNVSVETTPSCDGNSNGTLLASAENGIPPYSYEWSDGTLGSLLTGSAGTYTLTVTDNTGFTASITAEILNETSVPVCQTKDITIQLDQTGSATISAVDVDNGSLVGCDFDTMEVSPSSFDSSNVGENTVTLTITDSNGNSVQCTAIVTVENPTLSVPENDLELIRCYPNPFNQEVVFIIPNQYVNHKFQIILYDIIGKEIINTIKITENKALIINNLNSLEEGVYMFKIINIENGNSIIRKLIKK